MYQYLFFLEHNKISVIHYDSHSKRKWDYEKHEGEKIFPIEEDFWIWWKDAVSYSDGEEVDFCFIYDKTYEILQDVFLKKVKQVLTSGWNKRIVEEFFQMEKRYSHIMLCTENGNEWWFDQQNIEFMDNSLKTFYTNREDLFKKTEKEKQEVQKQGELTPFAKYHKELLEIESMLANR